MKVALIADVHAGKKAFGMTVAQWLVSLRDAVAKANQMDIKVLIVAGDLYDRRDPNVEEVAIVDGIFREFKGLIFIATGNHELRAPDSHNAMYLTYADSSIFRQEKYGREAMFKIYKIGKYNIGILNWTTLEFFEEIDKTDTLQEQLRQASKLVIQEIDRAMEAKGVTKLDLFTGHAHIYYGLSSDDEPAPAPNLLAGRDILLPASELVKRTRHLYLGHVHTSRAKHYIGSIQPTDRADTEYKGFYTLDLETDDVQRHLLPNSLKITKVVMKGANNTDVIGMINERKLNHPIGNMEMLLIVLDNSMLDDTPLYNYTELRQIAQESGYFQCELQPIPPERKARIVNKDSAVVPVLECIEQFLDNRGHPQDKIDKVRAVVTTLQQDK